VTIVSATNDDDDGTGVGITGNLRTNDLELLDIFDFSLGNDTSIST
jgi:hypothetical protein